MANFSGKFVLRLPALLHRELTEKARSRGESLNGLCLHLLQTGIREKQPKKSLAERYQFVVPPLSQHFSPELLGVLIFGSQMTGDATPQSDVDFLIVLSDKIPLNRALYRWWDERFSSASPNPSVTLSPQFVHLPKNPVEASGLWYEVTLAHEVLYDQGTMVTAFLSALQDLIGKDQIRRYWSHGQPYWVRRQDAE